MHISALLNFAEREIDFPGRGQYIQLRTAFKQAQSDLFLRGLQTVGRSVPSIDLMPKRGRETGQDSDVVIHIPSLEVTYTFESHRSRLLRFCKSVFSSYLGLNEVNFWMEKHQ